MKAAVVSSFDTAPRCADFPDPVAAGDDEIIVSVATRAILAELPDLAAEISKGTFGIDLRAVPLTDAERAWTDSAQTRQRIVITPTA
jgi:hypothetical protein